MNKEYLVAVALLLGSLLKAFGIELESGVLEGIITGLASLWIAFNIKREKNLTMGGVKKA